MQLKLSQIRIWSAASVVALLTACGGGGGGGSSGPATSTETFQLRTAYVSYIQDTRSLPFTVTGNSNGIVVTGSGTTTQGSLSSTTFEGKAAQAKTSAVTGTLTVNGQKLPLAATDIIYVDSNYNPLGFDSTEYAVVTSSTPIPATARVGDTGTLYKANLYNSSSKVSIIGTETATFVLEPDTANTALLKIIQEQKDTSNTVTSTGTITFRMTPAGGLTRLSETLLEGTTSLTITY